MLKNINTKIENFIKNSNCVKNRDCFINKKFLHQINVNTKIVLMNKKLKRLNNEKNLNFNVEFFFRMRFSNRIE